MNALRFLPLLICALIAWHGSALDSATLGL
jgi:hypothetical protein